MKDNFLTLDCGGLFEKGDRVGVGCSGGSDSVALLHFLASHKKEFDIEVIAIHIDHCIRKESDSDLQFVKDFAKRLGVRFYSFKIDVPSIAKERGLSLESAGREARYNVFKALKEKGIVSKVALAHHKNDQAETILMHIFRGSGLTGAKGMEKKTDNFYIRTFLDLSKADILSYIKENELEFVEDKTNDENVYGRNFIRNVVLKEVETRFPGVVDSIVNFGKNVKEDEEYIDSQVFFDGVIVDENIVKIPISSFLLPIAISSRLLRRALGELGIKKDIERKHILSIRALADGENGKRISLPFGVKAIKEYDYLTLSIKKETGADFSRNFRVGEIFLSSLGKIIVEKVKNGDKNREGLIFDRDKLPRTANWRIRQEGDYFVKFGGGRKKLKSFFINKKVPARIRNITPVLADGNEVYLIAGLEISDKIKVDETTKNICRVRVEE